jgi:hypothetical protein
VNLGGGFVIVCFRAPDQPHAHDDLTAFQPPGLICCRPAYTATINFTPSWRTPWTPQG